MPTSTQSSAATLSLVEEVVRQQLQQVDHSLYTLKFPPLRDYIMEVSGLHFHFNPEFAIGLNGSSLFEFINDRFPLGAREMAVIPAGIPHRELPQVEKNGIFQNIIVSVYNQTVCLQLQTQREPHESPVVEQCYLDSPKFSQLATYLNEMSEFQNSKLSPQPPGIKGLLLAYLDTLRLIIEKSRELPTAEKLKISQVKKLVHEHIGSSELSVRKLAQILHCSPDYLSHLFHSETAEYLAAYINRQRVEAAMELLRTTALTISEIAFGVGFENPAYFSQVFKQITLKSPQTYRRSVERTFVELEGRPKTIYAHE
jgi:AraC-like DNA-binding protein